MRSGVRVGCQAQRALHTLPTPTAVDHGIEWVVLVQLHQVLLVVVVHLIRSQFL